MPPPCPSFPAKDVPLHVQVGIDGKRRKTEDLRRPIDLVRDCELFGFVQYECSIDHPEIRDSRVRCWPVQRLFRQCQDKNGKFTVETTAWEGTRAAAATTTTPPNPHDKQIQETSPSSTVEREEELKS